MVDYDVAIIGAGIGGLSAGALLAERGLKVIIIERNSFPGGLCSCYSEDGFKFDIGPGMFWGLEEGGVLNQLLFRLGILKELQHNILFRLNPCYQIVLPNHRLDIFSERDLLFNEIEREFSHDVSKFRQFYNEIDRIEEYIYEKKRDFYPYLFPYERDLSSLNLIRSLSPMFKNHVLASNFIKQWVNNIELDALINIQTLYFGRLPISQLYLSLAAIILGIPKKGVYYLKGGAQTLADKLALAIKRFGGDIVYHAEVSEIITHKGIPKGIVAKYDSIEAEIITHWIIADTPFSTAINKLIRDEKVKKRYKNYIYPPTKRHIPFSILLGVDEKVIPDPMKEQVFFMRDYNISCLNDNLIFISLSPEWDTARAPKGKRALTITTFLESYPDKGNSSKEISENKADEIISYIEDVIPFLKDYIVYKKIIDPFSYQETTMREKGVIGSMYNKLKLYRMPKPSLFSRLFFVGDDLLPSYGVPAVVRSGILVAYKIMGR